jgi:hypothetical protein
LDGEATGNLIPILVFLVSDLLYVRLLRAIHRANVQSPQRTPEE